MMCAPLICSAQNATITIGRGTDCFGRGACSITIENSNENNATFINKPDGTTILRILRLKLNKEDEDRILGEAISELNINELRFRMIEEIPIESSTELLPSSLRSKQIEKLKVGVYSTTITANHIDIEISGD